MGGPKPSKIRLSSPKLRVNFGPRSEIRTIFPPKIRCSPKKQKKKVFTEIESEFWAEIGNSNDFSAQNQVFSKKKKKRSSLKLRVVFRPKPLALLLLYCSITVMCAITTNKLQLNIVRLCCHNFLALVEF